ncbi:hypothetical protein HII31_03003 [Pseudocercospora fuligena]|uniref:BOD1/SHG1 domain-containing protein n=1 Tax=Pseudocercospora fuligena TaxID=685502 RepID=A0A8H6VL28_9PEZI|nr:hypothetical protein HII31_03003 [Pseudocercospora fuligena]
MPNIIAANMATMDVAMSGTDDFELPARKRPKIQELPLSGAQHDAIDSMLHTFKKKGEFDVLRKKAIQQYNESAERGMFEASLRTFTSAEIDRDPMKYLRPDKRIAAPLLEGSAARADVYGKTEADIDAYIDQFMASAERALRDIRRKEIGDEAVEEEIRKGRKTDAEYAAEAEQRRQDRAKKFIEDEKVRKRKEAQDRKKKELEALKKKQEALQKETERLQREQKRRAERDAWKLAEKERERERIKQFNEEREKAKKEAEEREKALQEERERRQKERQEREQKRLEAEALDLLLREGQEMAEKARRPELERSESMEPPARLKHQRAPKDSQGKDSMRAQGLLPTSLTLRKGEKPGDKAQGDKGEKESTPVIPTGPRKDRERQARQRSPSPARSTHSNRRRESSVDGPSRRRKDDEDEAPRRRRDDDDETPRRRPRDDDHLDRIIRDERNMPRRRDDDDDRPRQRPPREDGEERSQSRRPREPREVDEDHLNSIIRDERTAPRRRARYDDRDRDRDRDRGRGSEIDRYIPGGGSSARRSRSRDRDRERDRDRSRDRYRDRSRDRNVRDRSRERDRDRERDRERDRDRERRREDSRDRDRRGSKAPEATDAER